MEIDVQLFAAARDAARCPCAKVSLSDSATIGELRQALTVQYPTLAAFVPHLMFAIDDDYADDQAVLFPGANVAAIPPVSGG